MKRLKSNRLSHLAHGETFEKSKVCEHGGLERKCEICEREKELAALRTEVERLREIVGKCHLAVGEEPTSDDATLPEEIEKEIELQRYWRDIAESWKNMYKQERERRLAGTPRGVRRPKPANEAQQPAAQRGKEEK